MSWDRMLTRTRRTGVLKELATEQHTTGVSVTTGERPYDPPKWDPLVLSNGQYLELDDGSILEV